MLPECDCSGFDKGAWRPLDFQTHLGEHFMIRPGDILLAENTTGRGHSWRLVDDEPWPRAYMIIGDAEVPYKKSP